MARTIKGYNEAAKSGKEYAAKYCETWQKLLLQEGRELARDAADKRIDLSKYNKKRKELNEETKKLNDCIKSLNKRFG